MQNLFSSHYTKFKPLLFENIRLTKSSFNDERISIEQFYKHYGNLNPSSMHLAHLISGNTCIGCILSRGPSDFQNNRVLDKKLFQSHNSGVNKTNEGVWYDQWFLRISLCIEGAWFDRIQKCLPEELPLPEYHSRPKSDEGLIS